jgi:site-specific recombinase XerD
MCCCISMRSLSEAGAPELAKHTAESYAYDLRDWFTFLEVCEDETTESGTIGKTWDAATEDDYISYGDAIQDSISPHTRQCLSDSTIRRRQNTVENFYTEAKRQGWYIGAFLKTLEIKKGRIRPADSDTMVHLRAGRDTTREVSPYAKETGRSRVVHPLSEVEWRAIQRELGPLRSERDENLRPSRDRPACELSLTTGLRVDEAASLTVHHILKLNTDYLLLSEEDREYGYLKLYITKTKRFKARNVLVPCYFIPELVRYIDEERKRPFRPVRLIQPSGARRQGAGLSLRKPRLSRTACRECPTASVPILCLPPSMHSSWRNEKRAGNSYRRGRRWRRL